MLILSEKCKLFHCFYLTMNLTSIVFLAIDFPSRPTTVFLSAASETSLLVRFSGPAASKTNPVTKFRGWYDLDDVIFGDLDLELYIKLQMIWGDELPFVRSKRMQAIRGYTAKKLEKYTYMLLIIS